MIYVISFSLSLENGEQKESQKSKGKEAFSEWCYNLVVVYNIISPKMGVEVECAQESCII